MLDRVRALESEYLLQNYARYPLVLDRGKGCYVYDPPASAIWISSPASA